MGRYIWVSDTHLNWAAPWTIGSFILFLRRQKPEGVFITGDISSLQLTPSHLKLLSYTVACPIYFILGNHDFYLSTFDEVHQKIKDLCSHRPNLFWLPDEKPIALTDETCIIGADGWYSGSYHHPKWLRFTLDWLMIKDLKRLSTMEERFEMFRQLSQQSAELITEKLELAFQQGFKNVYLLTHMPPWKAATRDEGTLLERYFLPYNVNKPMGEAIERVMQGRNNRHLTVLSGHTHEPIIANIARNIECWVGAANYLEIGELDRQIIMI